MLINLFSTELDNDDLVKRIKDENDSFSTNDIIEVVSTITHDILYSMFFEDLGEKLYCVIVTNFPGIEGVEYFVSLEESFYNKHIGKFIDKHKIINDIIVKFVNELEKVDWKKV